MKQLYPWLTELWQQWQHNLTSHTTSAAMLLQTDKGMGYEQLIERYIGAVMCSNNDDEACGFCHSCDLVKAAHHPDLHWIKPEKEGGGISVDQIRTANKWAQASSQLNGYRLLIIEPAEAMNESAANALLKTLEEPGNNCLYLLVTHQMNKLLPTVISRCQQWYITEPKLDIVVDWLSTQTQKKRPEYVVRLNHNAPLSALDFIQSGQEKEYQALESEFIQLFKTSMPDVLSLTTKILQDKPSLRLIWLWQLLTDTQKVQFGLNQSSFVPGAMELSAILSYKQTSQLTDSLLELINTLDSHSGLNAELMITNWLFNTCEAVCL